MSHVTGAWYMLQEHVTCYQKMVQEHGTCYRCMSHVTGACYISLSHVTEKTIATFAQNKQAVPINVETQTIQCTHGTVSCFMLQEHVIWYSILSNVTGACHMSQEHVTCYSILPHVTGAYFTLQEHARCYQRMSNATCCMSISHVTRACHILQDVICNVILASIQACYHYFRHNTPQSYRGAQKR